MSDIQTVREALQHWDWQRTPQQVEDGRSALDRIEAVVKAAREFQGTNVTAARMVALDDALAALDPTEAPHGEER